LKTKNDLIPSKSEVDEFIAWEKDSYESDTECQKGVNMFCEKENVPLLSEKLISPDNPDCSGSSGLYRI